AQSDDAPPPAKRRSTRQTNTFGDPLPAHRVTLFGGSALLRSQAERWVSGVELRVPLGSPEDVPHARSALRFLYTGTVDGGSSAEELLQLRRQADYLVVEGCVEACDAALLARVKSGELNVAELFACRHLLPSPDESGGDELVEALLAACREVLVKQLVKQLDKQLDARSLGDLLAWAFRDAPSLLCDFTARSQMLQLSADAMEALLGSELFATDDEATVLLMVAEWRWAQEMEMELQDEAVDRLCRLVRLSQLPEDYLVDTLPHIPWFPLTSEEHSFLRLYARSFGEKRTALTDVAARELYDLASPWYAASARPFGRSDLKRAYRWSIEQESIKKSVTVKFDNGDAQLVAHGFRWWLALKEEGEKYVGVYLGCSMPEALCVSAVRKCIRLARASARMVVYRYENVEVEADSDDYSDEYMRVDRSLGRDLALPLAAYIHKGKVTGSLTFV
ncbi:hypothetical protein TSOC_014735, partial [Tetrabaena socialis]